MPRGRPKGVINQTKAAPVVRSNQQATAGGRDLLGRIPETPNEKRASLRAAVTASLYLGESVPKVAVQYGLTQAKVLEIKEAFEDSQSVQRRDWLSEILVIYIQQEIKSLMAISIVTSDEEWVMAQNAGDLAMYIATKNDKLTQLLQSFGRVANEREQYVEQLEAIVQDIQ